MTTFLIWWVLGMALAFLVCCAALYRLWALMKSLRRFHDEERHRWMEEREHMRSYAVGITRVLNTTAGGLGRRICENQQIANELIQRAPHLYKECMGLAYWLDANDQFLNALLGEAATHINPWQRHVADRGCGESAADIFNHIYACAGLKPPVDARPN